VASVKTARLFERELAKVRPSKRCDPPRCLEGTTIILGLRLFYVLATFKVFVLVKKKSDPFLTTFLRVLCERAPNFLARPSFLISPHFRSLRFFSPVRFCWLFVFHAQNWVGFHFGLP